MTLEPVVCRLNGKTELVFSVFLCNTSKAIFCTVIYEVIDHTGGTKTLPKVIAVLVMKLSPRNVKTDNIFHYLEGQPRHKNVKVKYQTEDNPRPTTRRVTSSYFNVTTQFKLFHLYKHLYCQRLV